MVISSRTLRGDPFSGNDIPGVPRHKGSVGADIHFGRGFLLNARANFVGSRYLISDWANQVEKLDGYYTVDAKLSYSWKGLKAFCRCQQPYQSEIFRIGLSPMPQGRPNSFTPHRSEISLEESRILFKDSHGYKKKFKLALDTWGRL